MWGNAHEKKGVKRLGHRFGMNGEVIANVADKYLGCIINQHVESRVMVDSRAKAGQGPCVHG